MMHANYRQQPATLRIEEVKTALPVYVDIVNALLPQLTSVPAPFTLAALKSMLAGNSSRLFIAFCGDEAAGMLTLATYLTPTGSKSWVEDVVVDARFRGQSVGRRLVEYAMAEAGKIPDNQLMLTSKPARVAANALYRSVGFRQKETNVYRMAGSELPHPSGIGELDAQEL